MNTAVIVNPRSAGNRTGKEWASISRTLTNRLGPLEIRFTERIGHATELARELLLQRFDRIIGVGGDGTFNEIANGFIASDEPVRPSACMGILPMGTGGDFQRSLRIPADLGEAVESLAGGQPVEMDLGKATFQGYDGRRQSRYFVNLVSFGMGGEVSARAQNILSPLGGKIAFFYATLKVFLYYRGKPVELTLDNAGEPLLSKVLNVAIGNGNFHGGGMHVCPAAMLNDGILDVTVIEDLGILTLLKDMSYLYDGNIYAHPKVSHYRATKLVATSPEVTRIEVDGEPLGALPLEVTVLPRSLKIIVPPDSPLRA